MSVDFTIGSPFATMLQGIVQPKLAEFGWTAGGADDVGVFEYLLALLSNNKNETEIASELATDLLDLPPDNSDTAQFAHWLFERIHELTSGGDAAPAQDAQMEGAPSDNQNAPQQDTDMDGALDAAQGSMYDPPFSHPNNSQSEAALCSIPTRLPTVPVMEITAQDPYTITAPSFKKTDSFDQNHHKVLTTSRRPTGPKAMRNGPGSNTKPARGGRMLNQLNRQMGRNNDDPLHRVRGSQGAGGRINSHGRDPPKGPRSDNLGRGIAAMANGRGAGNVNMGMPPNAMPGMNGINMGMPPMPMPPMGQGGMPGMLNPQQQMALMQMYEQQAQMMQQIFSGQTPAPFVNPSFQHRKNNRPLNDRVSRPNHGGNKSSLPPSSKFTKKEGQDETMTDGPAGEAGEGMDVEGGRTDPFQTLCKFNLRCSRPDCIYAHQSPAAPEGTPVDMKDKCTFGAKCTNKKCVGRHPSPAQRLEFQKDQDCAFWPNCRDPAHCPYRHPTAPACRNGPDCTVPNCKFWHSTVMCKFNPCTNRNCTYKHVEGQKKLFQDRVWIANKDGNGSGEKKEHVSERKFVDEDAAEELIIPGQTQETGQEETQVMTE